MLFDLLGKIFRGPMDDDEKVRLAQQEIETEKNVLVGQMLKRRPRLDPAKMQWFSEQQIVHLDKAHSNAKIWNRGGRGLFITKMDGTPTTTLIRFNDRAGPTYEVRPGHIKGAFQGIYLTNAAEAGKTLKFVVGYRNFAEFELVKTEPPTTPVLYNIVISNANEEYSQALGAGVKHIRFHLRNGGAFRYAWVADKVAKELEPFYNEPIINVLAVGAGLGSTGIVDLHPLGETDLTLYFASGDGLRNMEIECWS